MTGDAAVGSLTESLEDYLEIIFLLLQVNKVARVRDIARRKDVKTSSVISALRRLANEGLVDYRAHEFVDLTDDGKRLAFKLYQRHVFLKRFLVNLLQVDPETAEKDACSMEHAISVTSLDRLSAFAEFLAYCPRVDDSLMREFRECWLKGTNDFKSDKTDSSCEIWNEREAALAELGVQPLTALPDGTMGHVARIIGPEEARKKVIRRGILPATSVLIKGRGNESNIILEVSNEEIDLPVEEASMIYIWVSQALTEAEKGSSKPKYSLADLQPGNSFQVVRLIAKGEIRQRLLDMGFAKGAQGKMLREALLKDPIEVEIGGYLLSMRRSEAAGILVEELDAT